MMLVDIRIQRTFIVWFQIFKSLDDLQRHTIVAETGFIPDCWATGVTGGIQERKMKLYEGVVV